MASMLSIEGEKLQRDVPLTDDLNEKPLNGTATPLESGDGYSLGRVPTAVETSDPETAASRPVTVIMSRQSTHPLEQTGTPRTLSPFKWFLVCVALYSACFMYGLDNTIVADIQSPVIETFGNVQKLAWIGSGFPLGSVAAILPLGRAYGIFNIKWLFIGSLVMFEAGSALCGGAPNIDALIVGRVWAGAGGAGHYLGVLNIIALNTSLQERPIYIGLVGLTWGLGCILGPVIGGSFADSGATWRWSFYINLLIFAVCSPIYLFVVESFQPDKATPYLRKLAELDWVGILLNAGMWSAFVLAFTFGGTEWAWSDGRTIALIVVWVVLLLVFGLQQSFTIGTTKEHRLFPVDFVLDKAMVLQYIAMSAGSAGLFVPVYYIPLYFSFARGDRSIDAAVRLLPFVFIAIFFIMLNGAMMSRWGYYMPWYLGSGIFLVAGGATMYTLVDQDTSNSTVYGLSVLCAIGAGLSQQAAYSVTQAKVPPARIADATGFINVSQIGAIVLTLTITGAIFQNLAFQKVSDVLAGLGFSAEDVHSALAGAKSSVFETVSPEVRRNVIAGIVDAISNGYILVIAAGAVNIIAAVLMKREKLFMEMTAGG